MSIFDSDLLKEYMESFQIWHRITQDDDYGGYTSTWVKGASFDGILTEDSSLTATVAGIDKSTKRFGVKVKRDTPLEYHSVFRNVKTKEFYQIITGDPLKSPKMSAMNMKILSCEAYEPTDWVEPVEGAETNGNS